MFVKTYRVYHIITHATSRVIKRKVSYLYIYTRNVRFFLHFFFFFFYFFSFFVSPSSSDCRVREEALIYREKITLQLWILLRQRLNGLEKGLEILTGFRGMTFASAHIIYLSVYALCTILNDCLSTLVWYDMRKKILPFFIGHFPRISDGSPKEEEGGKNSFQSAVWNQTETERGFNWRTVRNRQKKNRNYL